MGSETCDLSNQFDHMIWAGDFNYRQEKREWWAHDTLLGVYDEISNAEKEITALRASGDTALVKAKEAKAWGRGTRQNLSSTNDQQQPRMSVVEASWRTTHSLMASTLSAVQATPTRPFVSFSSPSSNTAGCLAVMLKRGRHRANAALPVVESTNLEQIKNRTSNTERGYSAANSC